MTTVDSNFAGFLNLTNAMFSFAITSGLTNDSDECKIIITLLVYVLGAKNWRCITFLFFCLTTFLTLDANTHHYTV